MSDESKAQKEGYGEGNKKADRRYREEASDFADTDEARDAAEEAREAIEGPEAEELERAEEKGRERARR